MPRTAHRLHESKGYRYIDEGPVGGTPPLVLLHGMLGNLSNWSVTVDMFSAQGYRVLVPLLPVYELPLKETSVSGLVAYVHGFLETFELAPVVLAGNSLGGHVALLYTLSYPEAVSALVLSGSSGIYEAEIGTSTMRRRDRAFIRDRAAVTFYDKAHVTEDLIDEVYEIVNDRGSALRLIRMARSTQQETLTDDLARVKAPTLLVWGRDDAITPPDVAEQFKDRMPNADLRFIDQCGHAPMIEHPAAFNAFMLDFLRRIIGTPAPTPSDAS